MLKRFDITRLLNFPLRWTDTSLGDARIPGWGKLPFIAVSTSAGVWVLAIAYNQSRSGLDGGMTLFWLSAAIMYLPIAARFVSRDVRRQEAIGMVFILSICTFLFNYLRSPTLFRGFDEFLHWRTAYDILQTHHLFTFNSLLPVSPLYPGLESAAAALSSLSGLSIINAGYIVLLASRIIMLLSLYLIFERITKSPQAAGIATMVYTGSSTFLFFDMGFGYESMALPLAAMSIYMLLRRSISYGRTYWAWTVLVAVVLFAIVPTHHATSYALVAFLVLWTCADLYIQWQGFEGTDPFSMAAWLMLLSLIWVSSIARITLEYLSPIIGGAYDSLAGLLTGQSSARHLFENSAGQSAASIERWLAYGSVLVLGIGLMFGLWQWWLGYRRNSIAIAFAIGAMIYPVLPLMRLSAGAWEVSNRLSGFIFIALGYIVALGMTEFPLPPRWFRVRQVAVVVCMLIIFMGGIVAGSSPQTRLPSPYLPAAEERSVDNQGVMAAEWARNVLGSNNRMVGDRTETTLMGSYGAQRMIVNLSDGVSVSGLFLRYSVSDNDRAIISNANIRYMVIDKRISTVLPILGYYFEKWEQLIVQYVPPVNSSALEKYDHTKNVSRIFDSGDIVIYDIGALGNAP
jgi:hypothetical protein